MTGPALPQDLLDRDTGEAVRRLALAQLDRAAEARRALEEGEDSEALHDFRVALRRLRTLLRAYPRDLGDAVGGKARRRLKRLAGATNAARDAEVGLLELDRLLPEPTRSQRRGLAFLRERLERTLAATHRSATGELLPTFDQLAGRLTDRLGRYRIELRLDGAPVVASFRRDLAERLRGLWGAFAGALAAARDGDDAAVHAARIAAKRLRYLIEPACEGLSSAKPALARLRALQDILGEVNDLRQLADIAARAAAELEATALRALASGSEKVRRPPERTGLREIERRIAPRRAALRERLSDEWLNDEATASAALGEAMRRLEAELGGERAQRTRRANAASVKAT